MFLSLAQVKWHTINKVGSNEGDLSNMSNFDPQVNMIGFASTPFPTQLFSCAHLQHKLWIHKSSWRNVLIEPQAYTLYLYGTHLIHGFHTGQDK